MHDREPDDFLGIYTYYDPIAPIVRAYGNNNNAVGIYFNPNAQEGFQYVAAFLTTDEETRAQWLETFGVTIDGEEFVIDGRCGSKCLGLNPANTLIDHYAAKMIEEFLLNQPDN